MNCHINKKSFSALMLLLTACSSGNITNDWDCPKQEGYGCINIESADSLAIDSLRIRKELRDEKILQRYCPTSVTPNCQKSSSKIIDKIWFSPYLNNNEG